MIDVRGWTLENALHALESDGFTPEVVMTQPPRGRKNGVLRVLRLDEATGALLVARFMDCAQEVEKND